MQHSSSDVVMEGVSVFITKSAKCQPLFIGYEFYIKNQMVEATAMIRKQ